MIGLAGRPGCGKSAVARELASRPGVETIDLDPLAWQTYHPGTATHKQLVRRFGREILSRDGWIDRAKLARVSLVDVAAQTDLASIVHPAVIDHLDHMRCDVQARGVEILLVEGALLASSEYVDRTLFDAIIWMEASDATRRRRLQRDGRETHGDRMEHVHRDGATDVVDAEGTVREVAERVWHVIQS